MEIAQNPDGSRPRSELLAVLAMGVLAALLLYWRVAEGEAGHGFLAAGVAAAFAMLAYLLRAVTAAGGLAGFCAAFVFYGFSWRAFALLFVVFVITWLSTKIGEQRKTGFGRVREKRGRTASQIAANLFVATLMLEVSVWQQLRGLVGTVWLIAAVAALAELAADTCSSEVGELFPARPRLITTLKPVARGTDGAISLAGTLAGVAAAVVTACVGAVLFPFQGLLKKSLLFQEDLLSEDFLIVAGLCGVMGMFFDSLLGATLERRGLLRNNYVNLLSTAAAALLALALLYRGAPMP